MSIDLETVAAQQVASLMAAAARITPKTRGIGLLEPKLKPAPGIPLRDTGKHPFFDH